MASKLTPIKRQLTKWKKRLSLHERTFIFHLETVAHFEDTGDAVTHAYIWWQAPATHHDVYIYPAFFDLNETEKEQTLLHELVHVLLQTGDETIVSRVAGVLWTAYDN